MSLELKLRALGLVAAIALGLMAFTAAGAQAENLSDGGKPAEFRILGQANLVANLTFNGSLAAPGTLLVPGLNIKITCLTAAVQEGVFQSTTQALVKVLFSECLTYDLKGKQITSCILEDTGPEDRMITALARALPKKHNGKLYVLFEADPPLTRLAVVNYEKETGCPLPLKTEIKGSVVAEVLEGEQLTQFLEFSQAIQNLFQVSGAGDKLTLGASEAFIDATQTVELTGAEHLDCSFGIV